MSVITPVLNSAASLELTLASVASQTYPNIEHIVVDGGSTDGTIDVLRRFRSTVPLRWVSEPDSGMYAAINKGLGLARGDVLSYLNSDDLYLPWSVERAVSALVSSGSDLVFGDVMILRRLHGFRPYAQIYFYPRFRPRVYAYEVNMGQAAVLWRRHVSETLGGFDEGMRYAGDFEYWLRTGSAGYRYVHVREVIAVVLLHEEALSTVHEQELRGEIARTRARYADRVKPRKFLQFRALTRLIHWRRQVLRFRINLRKDHPSSWPNVIQFLRRTDSIVHPTSIVPLLLPVPLPKNWGMWGLDAAKLEIELAEEFRRRSSEAKRSASPTA